MCLRYDVYSDALSPASATFTLDNKNIVTCLVKYFLKTTTSEQTLLLMQSSEMQSVLQHVCTF